MKNFLILLVMLIASHAHSAFKVNDTKLVLGINTDVDNYFMIDRAGSNDPFIKWDSATGNFVFSEDGTTFDRFAGKTYVDSAIAGATIADADATTKGKLKLAGDLGGTANLPTVPALATKADISYVDAAIAGATIADADATTKGKLKLAGDLGGTADLPTVPALATKASQTDLNALDTRVDEAESDISDLTIANSGLSASKVAGPTTATDNAVARWDTGTGKLLQDSSAQLDDSGNMTAYSFSATNPASTSSFSGLQINNGKITASSGNLTLDTTSGVIYNQDAVVFNTYVTYSHASDSTSGDEVTINTPTVKYLKLTGATLNSLAGIQPPSGTGARELVLINLTGKKVKVLDNSPFAFYAGSEIYTGNENDLDFPNRSAISMYYDQSEAHWIITGGISGAGGTGDPDTMHVQDFENASLTDFNQVGLVLDTGSPLNGEVSGYISHAVSATTYDFQETVFVPEKFRGRNMTLEMTQKSSATNGNVTISVGCASFTDLVNSQQMTLSNATGGDQFYVSFDVPASCTYLTYSVYALPQAGPPVSRFDDVKIFITKFTAPTSGLIQEADSEVIATGVMSGTTVAFTSGTVKGQDVSLTNPSITVLKKGIYSISFYANIVASGTDFYGYLFVDGVIKDFFRERGAVSSSGLSLNLNYTGELNKNSVVTVGGILGMSSVSEAKITVTKQGSLKQVSINSNSKITIPTSEIIFTGSSSRGSTATTIVKFDTVSKVKGDAFEVNPLGTDTTLGTHIRMLKAGKLDADYTLAVSRFVTTQITVNGSSVSTLFQNNAGGAVNDATRSDSVPLLVNVGDIIRIGSNAVPYANSDNQLRLVFQEQEIQVSVNNVLPQYSESDVVFKGAGNGGQAITANVTDIPFTATGTDTSSSWSGSAYTVKESGVYDIKGGLWLTTGVSQAVDLYVNGSNYKRISVDITTSVPSFSFSGTFDKGQVLSFRITTGATLNTTANNDRYHYLNITKTGKPNVTGVDVTPFVDLSQIGGKGALGEVIDTIDPVTPNNFISTANKSIGSTGADYSGDAYKALYLKIWSLAGTVTTAGHPFRIASAKGTTAEADWANGKLITVDFQTNGVFRRTKSAARDAGSYQASQNKAHNHIHGLSSSGYGRYGTEDAGISGGYHDAAGSYAQNLGALTSTRGGAEANPNEVAMYSYMRYQAIEEVAIATPMKSFTLATTPVYWSGTACTSSQIGCYNTYSYAINTITKTLCAARPTQTDAHIAANGFQIFTRAHNAASTCGNPARLEVMLGQGMEGFNWTLYKTTGKGAVTAKRDFFTIGTTAQYGFYYSGLNPSTGAAVFDSGLTVSNLITTNNFEFNDLTGQTNGYLDISAGKLPAFAGISFAAPRVAFLSDVKASGTQGGGPAASGTWYARALNTEDDQSDFLTLSGNQFTLQAGEYSIEGCATGVAVTNTKARIRNITAAATVISGSSEYSSTTNTTSTCSRINGRFTITAQSVFELQQIASTLNATNGWGNAMSSGEPEVYSQLKITKVK